MIPMSIVRLKSLYDADEGKVTPKPTLLYGYGSYGICIDPGFDRRVLPYLDRGVVYCVAHIRGGGEMGRYWWVQQSSFSASAAA